jgi:hypothetical protein
MTRCCLTTISTVSQTRQRYRIRPGLSTNRSKAAPHLRQYVGWEILSVASFWSIVPNFHNTASSAQDRPARGLPLSQRLMVRVASQSRAKNTWRR